MRFALEIIEATRAAVGPDFPIAFRFSQWKQSRNFSARIVDNPEQLEFFLGKLVDAGVDIFDVSTLQFYEAEFPKDHETRTLAGWTKHLTGKTTIVAGGVGLQPVPLETRMQNPSLLVKPSLDTILMACEMLDAGEFDLISSASCVLIDHEWMDKLIQGRFNDLKVWDPQIPFSFFGGAELI